MDRAHEAESYSWAGRIRHRLEELRFGFVWQAQDVAVAKMYLPEIIQRMLDTQRGADLAVIERAPKNRWYALVNAPGEAPSYWSLGLPFHMLRFMAQLRITGIPLGWRNLRVLDLALVKECRCAMRPRLSLYHLLWDCDAVALNPWPKCLAMLSDLHINYFWVWLRCPTKQMIVALYSRASLALDHLSAVIIPEEWGD